MTSQQFRANTIALLVAAVAFLAVFTCTGIAFILAGTDTSLLAGDLTGLGAAVPLWFVTRQHFLRVLS